MIRLRLEGTLRIRRFVRPLIIATIVSATTACAPLQTMTGAGAPVEQGQPEQISPAVNPQEQVPKKIAPAQHTVSPAQRAVTSLLKEGWAYYRVENHERSIAIAERAQRLDPQRAEVYLLLAKSYLALGQPRLAEQLGQRGVLLSQNDATVRRRLQRLLHEIQG